MILLHCYETNRLLPLEDTSLCTWIVDNSTPIAIIACQKFAFELYSAYTSIEQTHELTIRRWRYTILLQNCYTLRHLH